jgi:hypothetical protein
MFFAKCPPVYVRDIHLVYQERPWYLSGPFVASLRELYSVVELQSSVEVGEFIVTIINTGRDDLFQPAEVHQLVSIHKGWQLDLRLVAIKRTEG